MVPVEAEALARFAGLCFAAVVAPNHNRSLYTGMINCHG